MMHLKIMLRFIARIFSMLLLLFGLLITFYFGYPFTNNNHKSIFKKSDEELAERKKIQSYSDKAKLFCRQHGFNNQICFLIDMHLPSGKNRFFVYDINKDSAISYGVVAHGSCNYSFLAMPKFSNKPGCGCSSIGKYKVGNKYTGSFGLAYKLYGLNASNSNAYKRNIVLHSYYLVPDKEVDPLPVCNSRGCVMVSDKYIGTLSKTIDASAKPILLWIFE